MPTFTQDAHRLLIAPLDTEVPTGWVDLGVVDGMSAAYEFAGTQRYTVTSSLAPRHRFRPFDAELAEDIARTQPGAAGW